MSGLLLLIPIALFLASLGLIAFFWTVKSGQYDDPKGESWRILVDDDFDDQIPGVGKPAPSKTKE
ncbi:MAG: cbb3-type cytochrome oxidase assembly protein CcoS [Robiginitomaculum sp.]|nr:MAG: cbb3-type cytochrome oxidase assembly protein CcoS [Robiginitomaculum sp.]